MGLPPDYRRRRTPGPPALTPVSLTEPATSPDSAAPEEAEELLSTVLNSRSWRLTAPLRRVANGLRRARQRQI